jgi:hypothetical protein
MTITKQLIVPTLAALVGVAGCGTDLGQTSQALGTPSVAVSDRGIVPDRYEGNFVSADDVQICYDACALNASCPDIATGDFRGFKVDPPVDHSQDGLSFTLDASGRYLSWTADAGTTVHAVVVKGGSAFNLYDYFLNSFDSDGGLTSPPLRNGKFPEISHYNVCYEVEPGDEQGCTPGYWRNHADRWLGVESTDDFDATFGVDLFDPNVTLGWAIWAQGGGVNALARHATAALLNAYGGVPNADGTTVAYPYTPAEVIQMVQDAVANGTIEETKDLFAAANELGCPLSGTRAVEVTP